MDKYTDSHDERRAAKEIGIDHGLEELRPSDLIGNPAVMLHLKKGPDTVPAEHGISQKVEGDHQNCRDKDKEMHGLES